MNLFQQRYQKILNQLRMQNQHGPSLCFSDQVYRSDSPLKIKDNSKSPNTKSPNLGYFNSIGNGFGNIDNITHINRYEALMNGRLILTCKDEKQKEKYYNSLEQNDYFINYQSKIAETIKDPIIQGMTINGIFKKVGSIKTKKDETKGWIDLEVDVIRIDITKSPFTFNVSKNFSDWDGDTAPIDWTGTKSVMFRGSVGNITESNYRYKFILDYINSVNH